MLLLNCQFVKIDGFYGMASESFHFLFIDNAVEFVLMAFICAINDYLTLCGISIHLKDFNALDSNIYNKRDTSLMHPLYLIIGQQNTLMVSISEHSDSVQTFLLVMCSKAHIMGMILNVS